MSDRPRERYFYHSFPRRSEGENEIDKGLQILRSIVKSGLLLTPEQTSWQEPVSGGGLSEPWKVIQKRACFTELATTELKRHSDVFGRFALEFEIQGLRQLGAIPVFYFPRASTDDIGMESVAASLLCRTGEIQVLLNRLGQLEYDGKSILFTGDEFGKEDGLDEPMEAAEKFMVDNQATRPIQSDVLIAAHHGADDASSTDFLKAVSPTFVVFPSGGSHEHPRQNVVTRMTRPDVGIAEANLFRTDQCDPPGPNEWPGAFVPGANDTFGDDDIDIVLTMGQPDPVVRYVTSALTCSP